jgi:hypothetical protein
MKRQKKKFFPKTPSVWKRSIVVILCTVLVGLTCCVKQKNCDCSLKGKFVYFEQPEEIYYYGSNREANAVFFSPEIKAGFPHYIMNSVPTKFRSKDTLNVAVCLKEEKQRGGHTYGIGIVYNLKCIEKED